MSQSLNIPGFGAGTGILAFLFMMGIILIKYNIDPDWGHIAIKIAIIGAGIYAALGVIGIIKKLNSRGY